MNVERTENRTVNLGAALQARVADRTRLTLRTVSAELRYLASLGVSILSPTGKGGAVPLELLVRPDVEPARRDYYTGLRAPSSFWRRLDGLAARCAWLRTPEERAWRGGPLFLRGRPAHLSRALRVAVAVGLDALAQDPALDPAPARRREYLAALRETYGDWRVKPEWDGPGSTNAADAPQEFQ